MKKRSCFLLGLGLVAGAVLGMSQDTYAAEVGDFDELKTCLTGTDATCTLTSDIAASEPLTVGRAVTLDLDEFELTYTDPNVDLFEISADGDLTITGDGEITAKRIVADVSGGKLTIKSGRIESEANFTIYGYDGATITIDGGEICGNWGVIGSNNTTGDMNVYIRGGKLISSIGATTIYMPTQMDLEISDGEVYGSIVARMGKITISGGTFYASSNYDSPTGYLNYSGSAWLPSALNLWVGSASYTSENARGTQLDLTISGGKFITTETETNYGTFGNADALTNAVALYEVGTAEQTANITITGGEFDGGVKSYSREDILGTAGAKTVTVTTEISGGMFSEEPEHSYVVEGKDIFQTDEGYVVENKINLPTDGSMAITLFKGESFDVGFELDKRGKYAQLIADDSGLYTVDGMTITAGDNIGSAKYKVNYGGLIYNQEPEEYDVEIVEVPEVEVVADEELGLSDETMTEIAEKVKGILEGKVFVAEDGTKSWVSEDGTVWIDTGYAKGAALNGEALRVEVWSEEILVGELDEEDKAQLNEMLEEGDTVVSLYDIELVIVSAEGYGVGGVDELSEPVTLTFAVPEEMREAPEGYTRKFYVVRYHYNRTAGGSEVERIEAEFDGENATIQNDKFSVFILTYQDVEETETAAPETGLFTKSEDYAERVSQRTRALVTMLSAGMLMMGYGMLQLGFGYRNKE